MGIRVDQDAMMKQLKLTGKEERTRLYFHKRLLEGSLPLSIGGGIGQSRLCMLYLRKAHIGEIQASIWPEEMRKECAELPSQHLARRNAERMRGIGNAVDIIFPITEVTEAHRGFLFEYKNKKLCMPLWPLW